jgi:hypothetical protein
MLRIAFREAICSVVPDNIFLDAVSLGNVKKGPRGR